MDGDLYDEFGNYIGPDLESDEEEENAYSSMPQSRYAGDEDEDEEQDEDDEERGERHGMQIQTLDEDEEEDAATSNAVVLHEV